MNVYRLFRPLLFTLPADTAHELTLWWARHLSAYPQLWSRGAQRSGHSPPALEQTFLGLRFPNPLGLAAGLDKNAAALPYLQSLGFGFLEIGSITAQARPGNPLPRSFRLPADQSLINRMGLNNDGAAVITQRLAALRQRYPGLLPPIGINIAKTHDPNITGSAALDDYRYSFARARDVADYITLNISCPNTLEGKTFEEPYALDALLLALQDLRANGAPPTLVKFSADLDAGSLPELLDVCSRHAVDGYVATNTSVSRDGLRTAPARVQQIGRGGLSGQAIRARSNALIRRIAEHTHGQVPIIGVGGIASTQDALEKLQSGAWILQIYTGLVFEGPGIVRRIQQGLLQTLLERGLPHLSALRPYAGTAPHDPLPLPSNRKHK
jgi:dihydroorotate dehydrogenase